MTAIISPICKLSCRFLGRIYFSFPWNPGWTEWPVCNQKNMKKVTLCNIWASFRTAMHLPTGSLGTLAFETSPLRTSFLEPVTAPQEAQATSACCMWATNHQEACSPSHYNQVRKYRALHMIPPPAFDASQTIWVFQAEASEFNVLHLNVWA